MNHIEKALEQGLPQAIAKISASLTEKYPDSAEAMQKSTDLVGVYYEARGLSAHFGEQVQHFAQLVGGVAQMRPNGIKSLERSVEKIFVSHQIPLDLLAGKVIFTHLTALYQAAQRIEQESDGFSVVAFRDRFVKCQKSGYRDLQFVVKLDGELLAELKFVLLEFDSLDGFEHNIYEIVRTLEAQPQGRDAWTFVQNTVYDVLSQSSKTMYSSVWKHCLEKEGGLEHA
jgi:hypothetical protein